MRVRPLDFFLAATAGAPFLIGLALVLRESEEGRPSLAGARTLANARRLDEAEARVHDVLRASPEDPEAYLLLAQLELERPEPHPGRALASLARIRGVGGKLGAAVERARGDALDRLGRYDEAESAWRHALALDPTIPGAGWSLLGLYYLQGRVDEARRLALELHAAEPDPRDRVQLLLELVRQDARPVDPASIVAMFEPIVRANPADLHSALTLGLALIRTSQGDRGVQVLRDAVARRPDTPDAWDAYLTGLDHASMDDALANALASLPKGLQNDRRFDRHRGRSAQARRDWEGAARAYRSAWDTRPDDPVLTYRLGRALRLAGREAEADQFESCARSYEAAREEVFALYEEADAIRTLGVVPHPDLYRRMAEHRERMGKRVEARAWLLLIDHDRPLDPAGQAAPGRLNAPDKFSKSDVD